MAKDLLERLPDTPMWKQYSGVKAKALDALLFYRMGDFYELFLDDAIKAAEILGITLTARHKDLDNPVPMCGVPFHSATNYINKLLENGCRVAICEQTEDPGQAKGIVKRDIVRVVSPGMIYDADSIDAEDSSYLASIALASMQESDWTESSFTGSCAFIELSTGELFFANFTNLVEAQNILSTISPRELLAPERFFSSKFYRDWKANSYELSQICETGLADRYFRREEAHSAVCRQYGVKDLGVYNLEENETALTSIGAALKKIRETQIAANLAHIRSPREFNPRNYLQLDESTIDHLDILPKPDRNENESLFFHLNHTKTAMGARRLKQMLVRPLLDIDSIQVRQGAVEAFSKNSVFLNSLRDKLKGTRDLERLLGKIGTKSASPKDLVALRETIARLPFVRSVLAQFKNSPLIKEKHTKISEFRKLAETLQTRLAEEAPLHAREGNIFARGWHAELDELIELSSNGRQTIANMEKSEREATGIANLKIKYNRVFGYFIEITKKNAANVPKHYVRKQTMANAERYITDELKEFEDKVLRAEEKRIRLETNLYEDLLADISSQSQEILATANELADIDALQSLAHVAVEGSYSAPKLTAKNELSIEEGRHPVLEKLMGSDSYISNSVRFSTRERIWLITGPNMSGKSTYMRQTALLVLMAHIGSFVPAKAATIGLVDRIASRVGASDRIGRGQSTFMVEMSEIARILNVATDRSLLIIDEIGRGTSTFDGLAIAWSIIEAIHDQIKARTLFATHYHELTGLADTMKSISNLHVEVSEEDGDVVFLHSVREGKASGSYGIEVARLAGVPQSVLDRAGDILQRLESDPKHKRKAKSLADNQQLSLFASESKPTSKSAPISKKYLDKIEKELKALDINACSPIEALLKIKSLKEQIEAPEIRH